MFQISNWPCCSAPFENVYFSLVDGKRLYTTNGEPEKGRFGQDSALMRIDGAYNGTRYSQSRYVGFGAVANARPMIPILQYGTDRAVKEQLAVLGHEYGDNFDVPEISVTEDGEQFLSYLEVNGQFTFTIVLRFSDGPQLRIPVENDVIRPEKATLPPGYSLRARRNDSEGNR
jgi:hypothetical protein